jgi:hypothetical protein
MRTFTILILVSLLFGFNSCKLCKKKDNIDKGITKTEIIESIIVQQGFVKPETSAMTDILKTSIEGNILTIEVSYSGGCNEHVFKLYFDGSYMKSLPPKVNFILTHFNNGDVCRSIVEKTLKFDISKAQYVGGKEMMVTVEGSEEMKYLY